MSSGLTKETVLVREHPMRLPLTLLRLVATLVAGVTVGQAADIRLPSFTAYSDPRPGAIPVSETTGITGWKDASSKILWFADVGGTGSINVGVDLHSKSAKNVPLRLTVGTETHEAMAHGTSSDVQETVSFGTYSITNHGYQRFSLELVSPPTVPLVVESLNIEGSAINTNAHFNSLPRRNAASVHLRYPTSKDWDIAGFYCEVTGLEDPISTYYMACGWHRGYFGMQVNSAKERRIIFSVWDSGNEAVSRAKVADSDRVQLLAKGEGVVASDFGNEGTGGHSHLVYPWKTGEVQRFYVTAHRDDPTHTTYSGYYFHPEKKAWMLIARFRAPKDGSYLRGLYSFSEDFWGANGHTVRKALYGNQWIQIDQGAWRELDTATFSHDPTGKTNRLDRFMGVEGNQFFLSHGG
ncbi:MAG TPA: DUF3472 domain-containing protein, partial [Candidatus Limnocylindria bacterium]|nr:DUF3472 domain-containing protein [Candidatus Limnocylindria bacterium]